MKVEELLKSNDKKDIGIVVPDDWQSVSYDCDQFALPTHYKKVQYNRYAQSGTLTKRSIAGRYWTMSNVARHDWWRASETAHSERPKKYDRDCCLSTCS